MSGDTFTAEYKTVADYAGTPFEELWAELPGDHRVVAVHDSATGLCCALAAAPGQPDAGCMLEARFQLALHIAKHASAAAGDPSDPRGT